MNKFFKIAHLFLLVAIFSCCKPKNEIPDVQLITDIIYETIKQNSLDTSIIISSNLVNRYIYHLEIDSVLGYLPPPPGNKNGEPFVFSKYLSDDTIASLGFRLEDSIFIAKQILLNKDIIINTNRIPDNIKFEDIQVLDYGKQNIYIFLVPVFNEDKNLAIVEYEYRSVCCGYGVIVYFRKIENKWIKRDSFRAWTC